ncbi:MAG: SlyX family protein [Tranquillimonas sp.]
MTDPFTDDDRALLEDRLSHLIRQTEDLSDVVADQARRIDLLERRVRLLLERAAEHEADGAGTVPLADQKPPHW